MREQEKKLREQGSGYILPPVLPDAIAQNQSMLWRQMYRKEENQDWWSDKVLCKFANIKHRAGYWRLCVYFLRCVRVHACGCGCVRVCLCV
jgi:hypothetical protein